MAGEIQTLYNCPCGHAVIFDPSDVNDLGALGSQVDDYRYKPKTKLLINCANPLCKNIYLFVDGVLQASYELPETMPEDEKILAKLHQECMNDPVLHKMHLALMYHDDLGDRKVDLHQVFICEHCFTRDIIIAECRYVPRLTETCKVHRFY